MSWRTQLQRFQQYRTTIRNLSKRDRLRSTANPTPYNDVFYVWADPATTCGLPATAAPIDTTTGGLPIGIQIIGPFLEDRTTIAFAELIEREFYRRQAMLDNPRAYSVQLNRDIWPTPAARRQVS
jgi:hypothetical protein